MGCPGGVVFLFVMLTNGVCVGGRPRVWSFYLLC